MTKNEIRRIVVTKNNTVMGILTATDLAAYIVTHKRGVKQVILALTRNVKVGDRYLFGA